MRQVWGVGCHGNTSTSEISKQTHLVKRQQKSFGAGMEDSSANRGEEERRCKDSELNSGSVRRGKSSDFIEMFEMLFKVIHCSHRGQRLCYDRGLSWSSKHTTMTV